MCSNSDVEHEGLMLMEKEDNLNLVDKECRKCVEKTQAKVILRKKDAYCKQCFLSSVTHKFRACLGKSKTMRPGDKVLVGFSGNGNSVVLLHLILNGLKETSHKRLMFVPAVLYIDESAALNLTTEERNKINMDINKILECYNYPIYKVPLELSLMPEEAVKLYLDEGLCSANDTTLQEVFGALADVTSKTDMLSKLRHNLQVQVAKSLGCTKVFTAETADDLAVKLLTNVSLGRGSQLPYDVGFSDNRFPEVKVIRPLRDLSRKEAVYYIVYHGLTSVHVPSLSTKIDAHSSIQKLTESFLCDLQDGFPSTLSTVFRVADKLSTNSANKNMCPLCQAPIDVDDTASSSVKATEFSSQLSSLGPSKFDAVSLEEINSSSSCCGGSDDLHKTCQSVGSCSSKTVKRELQDVLCYGCNLILKNADMKSLPAEFMKLLHESSQRFRMKKEIEEFLL